MIMGVASIWTFIKGTEDYVHLSHLLATDELLIMIGVDEETKKSLPDNIICIPHTQSVDELSLWYNIADVVLSLSRGETFGMTIAEAHACGTPTVVYNNTAQPELVEENTGHVVKNGDVEDLYEKIQIVKRRGKKYYSDACRKQALERYNKEDRYKDYITLYKELLHE